MKLFWVSFADIERKVNLGAALVEAESADDVLSACAEKGCLPVVNETTETEAMIHEIPYDKAVGPHHRLMSRLEWETYTPTFSVCPHERD